MNNRLSAITQKTISLGGSIREIFRSKYIELILAVALFIFLDTGVLILNFYTSYQIANDAHAIQIASRMGTLSQQLLHELYQVQEDADSQKANYLDSIDILAKSFKSFDETLDAFIYGGELIGVGQGQDALLKDPTYRNTSANLLKESETIWKTYRTKLKPIVYAYFNDTERSQIVESTKTAIAYARQQNDKLLELMDSFATAIEGVAKRKAERLRMIQSIGIILAVINFVLILFHFLKRLSQSDTLLEKSRKETENILENVNEGLFLLSQDYSIGSQHSKSLHTLFKNGDLAGQNFLDLLRPLVTEKTLDTVKEYTEILFSPRVNESLVADLNPLKQVEINLTPDAAGFDIRYCSFQFSRVYEKKGFKTLLVTIKDITRQVQLTEQLKAANEKAGLEIDMLLSIIHVENDTLTTFLKTTEDGLHSINGILKKPSKTSLGMANKRESIFRVVHKLKGESTVLGLDFVEKKFHRFEDAISELREKKEMAGEDFLPLVVQLNQLMSDFAIIGNLKQKMNDIEFPSRNDAQNSSTAGESDDPPSDSDSAGSWRRQMNTLVKRVADEYRKQVILDMSDFDLSLLAEPQREPVKDIVVQSLRNAIAHGIETPVSRTSSGKTPEGNLKVMLVKNGAGLVLKIRDDGQGIDLQKIRATAVSTGLATEGELSAWQPAKIMSLIFRQGFSTAQESGLHAGRGVGMDGWHGSDQSQSRLAQRPGQGKISGRSVC